MKQRKMRKKHGGRKRRDLKAVNATDLIGELDIEIGAMENTLTSFTEIFNKALSTNREDEYPFDHIHASIAINDKYRKPRNGPIHPRNTVLSGPKENPISKNSFSPNQPNQHSPEVIEDSAPTLFIDNNVVVNGHTAITIVTKDDGPSNTASDINISNNNSLSSIGSPGQGSDMEKEDRGTTATTISTLLPVGMHVCLHSLKAEKHNGAEGEIVEYDDVKGRYKVQISGKKKPNSIKPSNIRPKNIKQGMILKICHMNDNSKNLENKLVIVEKTDSVNDIYIVRLCQDNDGKDELSIQYQNLTATAVEDVKIKQQNSNKKSRLWKSKKLQNHLGIVKQTKVMDNIISKIDETFVEQNLLERSDFDRKMAVESDFHQDIDIQRNSNIQDLHAIDKVAGNNTNQSMSKERRQKLLKILKRRNVSTIDLIRVNNTTTDMSILLSSMLKTAKQVCLHQHTALHVYRIHDDSFWTICHVVSKDEADQKMRSQNFKTFYSGFEFDHKGGDIVSQTYQSSDMLQWDRNVGLNDTVKGFAPDIDQNLEVATYNVISLPITDVESKVHAVMTFGNRYSRGDNDEDEPVEFSEQDKEDLEFYCIEISNIFDERLHEISSKYYLMLYHFALHI